MDLRKKKGIPGVLGAIDGPHIPILKPIENQEDYVNRKGFHSVLIQTIVDHRKKILNVSCGYPGSMHDARMLRRSDIYQTIEARGADEFFPRNTFLLGDSAYPSLSWLVPPFKDNGRLSANHHDFNYRHSATRMPVEMFYGHLKGRFRRLKFIEMLDIKKISDVILACSVLHNIIIIEEGDGEVDEPQTEDNDDGVDPETDKTDFENFSSHDRRSELFQMLYT